MGTKVEKLLRQYEAELERLKSFFTTGNAGGAIATLGLIGAAIGTSPGHAAPRPMFWALAIFLLGLFGIWWQTVSASHRLIAELKFEALPKGDRMTGPRVEETEALAARESGFFWCEAVGLSIGSLCLFIGAIYGMVQLFRLTA